MNNKLQLTITTLNSAKDLKEMLSLPGVVHNAINNLIKTRGKTPEEAAMHYEREKVLFFKAIQQNKELEKCDRFSIYSSWIELHASGLTLNDGCSYIVPFGKQAQFMPGWKGRLDQMDQIPEIDYIQIPEVVREGDEFEYEKGENPRIIKHKPAKDESGKLTHVYLVIQKKTGKEIHLMNRAEVHAIRDKYSAGYKRYIQACKETNTEVGKPVKKDGQYGPYFIEPPMWITDEVQAWRKTIVKRAWNMQPNKTARMKALDQKIERNIDPEDGSGGDLSEEITYELITDSASAQPVQKQEPEPLPEQAKPQIDLGNPSEAF